ncbi:hypothetical protein EK21DRAFT_50030, partial [Setomelanomma holmii]
GLRYIWIHRYCIDQDNEIEKHHQIRKMGRITSQAHFTTVAAAGSDCGYGLPGVSARDRTPQECLPIDQEVLMQFYDTSEKLSASTWASRGWTFQEDCLSRRRLIFTEQEVSFLC